MPNLTPEAFRAALTFVSRHGPLADLRVKQRVSEWTEAGNDEAAEWYLQILYALRELKRRMANGSRTLH